MHMPEYLMVILVTAVIAALGYFLKGFADEQKVLIVAINRLTVALTKVETEVGIFNTNLGRIEKSLDELEEHVDAINSRLISIEKEHEERKRGKNDSCSR